MRSEEQKHAIPQTLEHARGAWHQRVAQAALRQCHALLTPRERGVMRLVVAGLLNKQMAAALGTSEITIKVHRGQVMRKMQAASVAELVRMATKLRLSVSA